MPSGPTSSCAGHATLVSCTMIGPGVSCRRSRHCEMMRSDSRISPKRTSKRA